MYLKKTDSRAGKKVDIWYVKRNGWRINKPGLSMWPRSPVVMLELMHPQPQGIAPVSETKMSRLF